MEKVLKLYKYVDGVNDTKFPNEEEQVVVSSFRYDAKRMGGAPLISCTVMHNLCLDKLWTENVYATFNGERFFVKQVPTSSYDNTDARYKHELELVSERILLDNVYFYDVVDSGSIDDKPVSHSSKFTFFGDIHEFVERLNQSLNYSKVEYSVVVDDDISSEAKMLSFQDQFFSNVLQEIYNTYEIPYYFVGKVIHIGFTENAITHTLKYGQNESLLSIQKQNANYKIVNRVTGVGSTDNIPYYYPNDYESKEEVESNGGTWVNPQTNLMPPIYRESLGNERFYNALNDTYKIPNSDEYYEFANPYSEGRPKEHIVNFDDIKPTIKGIVNASGYRIDMFQDFAYDLNDNDETDEEGNYLHPYFFAKLRKFDGEHGFNLFEHSIDEEEMTISMTSGSCGACEFVIGVDESTQKNIVQVDESGNLLRDDDGNVKFGEAQDRQNDTINNEVWIALRKDIDTFGVIMPNATSSYKPSVNDTFVILHIDLPKSYILAAEDKLKEELIKYMAMNNSEKFNFSISFSRIFFAENPTILDQLNENARIQLEYDNTTYELYVSSYSYAMSNDKPLPEIRVELSDTLTISQNALQTAISEVKQDVLSSVGSIDALKQGLKYFLRKDKEDTARKKITFEEGIGIGDRNEGKGIIYDKETKKATAIIDELKKLLLLQSDEFLQGELGSGFILKYDKEKKRSYFEIDEILVRKIAYFVSLVIKDLKHVGGSLILSPASMTCSKVEVHDTYYRCFFEQNDGEKTINNEFVAGDLARSQTFNIKEGTSENVSNTYYWRYVVNVGDNFIDLSITDCDSGSGIPKKGDEIVQLGNRYDESRQNAIILSTVGEDAPSIKQYKGIKYYFLSDDNAATIFSPSGNVIKGNFISASTGKNLDEEIKYIKVDWDKILEQTDKEFTLWFYPYAPTLDNLPASEWTSEELKQLHDQDMFFDDSTGQATSGKAWRFEKKNDVWGWYEITDAETIKALENIKQKKRVFVSQPTIDDAYDVGDLWICEEYGEMYKKEVLVCIQSKNKGESFSISHWAATVDETTSYIERLDKRITLAVTNSKEGLEEAKKLAQDGIDSANEAYQKALEALGLAGIANGKAEENTAAIQVNKDSITALANGIHFDENGNITNINTSGLVVTSDFATLFSQAYNASDETVKRAEILTFVTSDEVGNMISGAYIGADQIYLNGHTVINDNFQVDDNGNLAIDGSIVSTGKATIQLRNETGSSTITMRANTSDSNMFIYLDTPNGSTNLTGDSFSLYDGWGHALLAGDESDVVASFANATGYEQIEIGTSFIRFLNSNADQTVYLSNTSFWMSDLNGTTHYGYTGTVGGLKFYNGLCTGEA